MAPSAPLRGGRRTLGGACLAAAVVCLALVSLALASGASERALRRRAVWPSSAWPQADASANSDSDLDSYTTRRPVALVRVHHTKKRDLGLLALKAILLGPLIGLTIKAALIRGLIWAVLAYGLHLFFPSLLGTLGLGTGLVGFARQLRPDYNQMFIAYFLNLLQTLPVSMTGLTGQYRTVIAPLVESIRAIPEGHCRYRAVCETASQLVRNARSVSNSLQRISATVYMNFGNDYSKAWLDGVVQSDCAAKYAQCQGSPFSMVAARLAQSLGSHQHAHALEAASSAASGAAAAAATESGIAATAGVASTTLAPGPLSANGQLAAAIAQTLAPNAQF